MKLDSLHSVKKKDDIQVLREYLEKLKKLQREHNCKVLNEAKITITIDDNAQDKTQISAQARNKFVEQAREIGNFGDSNWTRQLVNGMKQAGVQGFNEIKEEESPVPRSEIQKLLNLIVGLVS